MAKIQTYNDDKIDKVLIMSKEETAFIIGLLTKQLAGVGGGRCPHISVYPENED